MKRLFFAGLLALGTSSLAFGSHTVCSAPDFYYSDVRHDFGTPPPAGAETGTTTIFYQGDVLLKLTHIAGLGLHSPAAYSVTLEKEELLASEGVGEVSGSSVVRGVAKLEKLSDDRPFDYTHVADIDVVCEKTWAMVP